MKFLRNIIAIALLLSTASAGSVKACGCLIGPTDFFWSLDLLIHHSATVDTGLHVVMGQVVSITPDGKGVRMKVLKRYLGPPCSDTVTIWGSDGIDCRLSPQQYYHTPNNDTIIAIMGRNGDISRGEQPEDFTIFRCDPNVLQVRSDSVFGGFSLSAFSAYGYPLDLFEDSLNKISQHLAIEIVGNTKLRIAISPNPAVDYLTIADALNRISSVTVINNCGQIITKQYVPGSKAIVSVRDFPPGLYLVRIKTTDGELYSEKFIKQ